MIKIKVCDVAPKGACSYYRGWGVFSKLRKINPSISVEYLDAMNWNHLSDCDILYLVRPVEDNYIEVLNMAKDFGVRVWSDFDDLLHEVPAYNPGHAYFSQKRILDNVEYAIKNSDIVTVSTETIKSYYQKLNPDMVVVENAFNDYNFKFVKKEVSAKRISWRGSPTHRQDLLSCKEDMVKNSIKFPDWDWVFIGADTWYVSDEIKNSVEVSELEIIKYNKFLSDITPAIHIVPLVDSVFNQAKSNISWIEGTSAGACCIAPALPEFQKSGVINYKDNFEYLLGKAINSKTFRMENYNESFEYIQDKLFLSKINQKRIKIIEEIL